MSRFIIIPIVFIFSTVLYACGENEVTPPAVLEISRSEVTFWPEGGEVTLDVHSNDEVSIFSSDSWCSVKLQGTSKLQVSATKNDVVGKERSAEVILRAGDITKKISIKQLAEEVRFNVLEESAYFNDSQTTEFSLTVISNTAYTIETPSWVEKVDEEEVNALTSRHFFKAPPLPQPESKRDANVIVKLDGISDQEPFIVPIGQSNKKSVFSSASYNILVGTWHERKELVYTIIDTYDFDIWGTQEGTLVHLTDITKKFDNYEFVGVGRDGGESGEYSAILYKTDRFDVLDSGSFWYSNTPDRPSYGWDATNYRRICSWGRFLDKDTYSHFYFFNSHFDHQGTVARSESAKLLLSMIESIVEPEYPIFSTGDLNCTPDSEPITLLNESGLIRDSRDLVNDPQGPEGTFNGLDPNFVSTNRIDYVFVSPEIDVKEYSVIIDRPDGRCPSDHDPVMIVTGF